MIVEFGDVEMMGLSTSNGYRQNVAQVVSQAAMHLHNSMGPIGTALLDRHGVLIFNNNALHYVSDTTLSRLASDCITNATSGVVERSAENGMTAWAVALDTQHVFVVVGTALESSTVDRFVATLRAMLPKAPADN